MNVANSADGADSGVGVGTWVSSFHIQNTAGVQKLLLTRARPVLWRTAWPSRRRAGRDREWPPDADTHPANSSARWTRTHRPGARRVRRARGRPATPGRPPDDSALRRASRARYPVGPPS